jgi:penicillin G amidase
MDSREENALRIVRYVLLAIVLLLAGAAVSAWWVAYRALPQTDGTASLDGLSQPVTVDRDSWGVPHIRADSLEDLVEAQGYVAAQDRLWQMDVLRRMGAGELSEIFGENALALDEQFRRLGLRHVVEREAANLSGENRAVLEAYARGVNRFIEGHDRQLPVEFFLLRYKPRPWTPADSMLILGYMYETLTTVWPQEINRDIVSVRVDADRYSEMYSEDSPDDRVVVGDDAKPDAKSSIAPAKSPKKSAAAHRAGVRETAATAPLRGISDLWTKAEGILASFAEESRATMGSNNWVVDGSHTASGKPLLANDTHLDLAMPSIWYIVHLTAPGWNVKGFALPGEPLVMIGHNDRIAWGFSNNGADVQDLYQERFNQDNQRQYLVNGKFVDAEVTTERIKVRGQPDTLIDVMATRHGPIVRRDAGRMFALRWTALQPGALSHSYEWLGRARNWQEFRESLRDASGPAQNIVYADVDGNIGFIVAAWIPIRKSGHGEVPVIGDTDEYEWTGYIPFDDLPQVLNPPDGMIVTANARVVGPGYKHYITDRWESPYRTARIYDLLKDRKNLQVSDMNAIQNDIVAMNDQTLANALVHAAITVKPRDPRTTEIISRLAKWDGRASADSVETSFVEVARDAFVRNLLEPYLSAETDLYQWRGSVLVDCILRDRPQKWLPADYHSYDELLMDSADQATAMLEASTHSKEISAWQIGKLNALTMNHPLGQSGILHRILSIGPMEQSGNAYAPKAMTRTHGPAMRFVADLSDWDKSLMEISSGESGELGSAHYKDQFTEWFAGRGIASPFSDAAEEKTRAHHLTLLPGGAR